MSTVKFGGGGIMTTMCFLRCGKFKGWIIVTSRKTVPFVMLGSPLWIGICQRGEPNGLSNQEYRLESDRKPLGRV
ncbi:hypothetical protein TNCT_436451 [Trichonephila clavata]|uniref:Uncharacterized protein n=1 Tax=Trichonephila clavata TaxID=2740835 RepID=A0A8X6F9J1_TRICU|nr:hypothetical protein TNCT_436451 [Trichonephila clavata]